MECGEDLLLMLGNLPGSNKFCIGNETIWDSIIKHVNDDIVIIYRDLSYKYNIDILKEEYKIIKIKIF